MSRPIKADGGTKPVRGLEVSRQASDAKSSVRKLARQYHPDRNQGDAGAEAKFRKAAYDAIYLRGSP